MSVFGCFATLFGSLKLQGTGSDGYRETPELLCRQMTLSGSQGTE